MVRRRGFRVLASVVLLLVALMSTARITAVDAQAGVVLGELPAPGRFGLVVWGGGSVTDLLIAADNAGCSLSAFWAPASGDLIGYIPQAPSFVNAPFLVVYPQGILPPMLPLLVQCGPERLPPPTRTAVPRTATPSQTATPVAVATATAPPPTATATPLRTPRVSGNWSGMIVIPPRTGSTRSFDARWTLTIVQTGATISGRMEINSYGSYDIRGEVTTGGAIWMSGDGIGSGCTLYLNGTLEGSNYMSGSYTFSNCFARFGRTNGDGTWWGQGGS